MLILITILKGMIDGALVGCFPQLYKAFAPAGINLAITL